MDNNILFFEKQKFNQWWMWAFIWSINGLFLFGLIKQLIFKQAFGDNPMSDRGLIIACIISAVLTYLFSLMELQTQISHEGVSIRFVPFQKSFKLYKWSEISKFYVRKYRPISEYGGWGIRFGKNGTAYNIRGDMGIQLEFLNNQKILIGTNRPQEAQTVLQNIENLKQNSF